MEDGTASTAASQQQEDQLAVDVVIVGGGLAGLSIAVALHRVDATLKIKVVETRAAPTCKYGGAVKLHPNGLKAAAAISPALEMALHKAGLQEKITLLHGEDGRLVTRLENPRDEAPAGPEDLNGSRHSHSHSHRGTEGCALPPQRLEEPDDEQDTEQLEASYQRGHVAYGVRRGAALATARMRNVNTDPNTQTLFVGWTELERLLISMLPPNTVEYHVAFTGYQETPAGVTAHCQGLAHPIKCRVLLGCDGPYSGVRSQCLQDGEPAYDHVIKWVGRLDGHQVASTPTDFHSFWLQKGQVFTSHPLGNGDVGWEALVTDTALQASGYTFDENAGHVQPLPERQKTLKDKDTDLLQALVLEDLYKSWPHAVVQMLALTLPGSILAAGVFVRSAADMPACMGKGRVALMGEAAHPLRPTGLDASMALEDAAELAAFVQEYGLCKEALRRYDMVRRPRWRHIMQLTAAQGASTTTGMALPHGFIDYTTELFNVEFVPLGSDPEGTARLKALHSRRRRFLWRMLKSTARGSVIAVALLSLAGTVLPSVGADEETLAGSDSGLKAGRALMARGVRRLWGVVHAAKRRAAGMGAPKVVECVTGAVGSGAGLVTGTVLTPAVNGVLEGATSTVKRSLPKRASKALGFF